MANIKISALPTTGVSTTNDFFVIDDAALTTTSKIQLKDFVGLIKGSGTDSMVSAPFLTSGFPATGTGDSSITLGFGASGTSTNGIAIGRGAEATSPNAIAIGTEAYNGNRDGGRDRYIAIGFQARAVSDTFALGTRASAAGSDVIALGRDSQGTGNGQISIGADAKGDGTNLISLGKDNGGSNINMNNSIMIGSGIRIADNVERSIVIGTGRSLRAPDSDSILIGGSGSTYAGGSVGLGNGNIKIGGFDDNFLFTPQRGNVFIGGSGNTYNTNAALGLNNVSLGLSGRTTPALTNHTLVENLYTFGNHTFETLAFTQSGNCIFNPSRNHKVNVTATGGTYDITSNVNPVGPGQQVVFYIEYFSGATVNFTDGTGFINWRWNKDIYAGAAPVFSASTSGTPSYSIITVSTWDNDDYWEVSRSMNME